MLLAMEAGEMVKCLDEGLLREVLGVAGDVLHEAEIEDLDDVVLVRVEDVMISTRYANNVGGRYSRRKCIRLRRATRSVRIMPTRSWSALGMA